MVERKLAYVEVEGTMFGLETRVRLRVQAGEKPTFTDRLVREVAASSWTFPRLRTRVWSLLHGYGWPRVA